MTLEEFLEKRSIPFQKSDEFYKIAGTVYMLIKEKSLILDEAGLLVLFPKERALYDASGKPPIIFKFGETFYYSKSEKFELNTIDYDGSSTQSFGINFPYLGLHTNSEVGSALPSPKEYVKKAKFLDYTVLGICERNTLANAFTFADACRAKGITPVIGFTTTFQGEDIKLFIKNETGWRNALKILKEINVDGNKEAASFQEYCYGLILVVSRMHQKEKLSFFEDIYFHFDTRVYSEKDDDIVSLEQQKLFLSNRGMKPVFIADTLYLEKDHYSVYERLTSITGNKDQKKSKDLHFKGFEEIHIQIASLFDSEKFADSILHDCLEGLHELVSKVDFIFNRLPKIPRYRMTEEDLKVASNPKELFFHLLEEGLKRKTDGSQKYIQRLGEELPVIVEAGFVDYFLINSLDVMEVIRKAGLPRGMSRGSAGGCLVSYLLNVTEIDPLKYNLLFSRFLNEGRLWKEVEEEFVKIYTESGEEMTLEAQKSISVLRSGRGITILAKEISESDILKI